MERITLGNDEFEGRNNAYVLLDGESVTLVDTGLSAPDIATDLEAGIEAAGGSVDRIDRILLTHWHPDHAALAGDLQARSGATVYVHESDAPLVREDPWDVLRPQLNRRFEAWDLPADKRAALREWIDETAPERGRPSAVEAFDDGATFRVSGRELEAVHAPGHTAGQTAFLFDSPGGREAVVGDTILPVYTPNVGGADIRLDHPLTTYLSSLDRLRREGLDRVWPGHRDPITDPAARIDRIRTHHRQRTERIVGLLREEGPLTPWAVAGHLFGELEGIHVLHGPGEAFAHLDHLAGAGAAVVADGRYRLGADPPDVRSIIDRGG